MIREIGIRTARALIDFSGGKSARDSTWETQLRGAVAIHNLLVRHGVAYLADEVGMGKTYVALGAVALMRHYNPDLRVFYVAPSENIQKKWEKELRNFTARNWLVEDNSVKSFQGGLPYGIASCDSLASLAREALLDPNRDFLVRTSSFSFGLTEDRESWKEKRRRLVEVVRWLDESTLDVRDKETFKRSYAAAVNAVMPRFDVVVVDEAHNLKHGLVSGAAARNHLLALVLGAAPSPSGIRRVERRFDRVLMLSATPLESDYGQLWGQLQVLGHGDSWAALKNDSLPDAERERIAARFLVRRLTSLRIAGKPHTKNLYRREWRNGGFERHDDPLRVADVREKLVVGLVQKKVSEVLQNTAFNNSFQIGMLASFESFMETARVRLSEEEPDAVFDDAEQTTDEGERLGIDSGSVGTLAASYRREFGTTLPHPKMDALVESLRSRFDSGEKALVFVRRVRSVDEIVEKLDRAYDGWLLGYLRRELAPQLVETLEKAFALYEQKRRESEPERANADDDRREEESATVRTFFGWFFRNGAPPAYFSGASFDRNRLQSEGSAYSTLFDDNYVRMLLRVEDDVLGSLARAVGRELAEVATEVRLAANRIFRSRSRQAKFPRQRVFAAYQQAGVALLAREARDPQLQERAKAVLRERYGGARPSSDRTDPDFPEPSDALGESTLFTELRRRPELRRALWPEEIGADATDTFRRQEQRRELLAAVARLGRPFIDLWILAANRLGSLAGGTQERTESRARDLIDAYLDRLEEQRCTGTGYTAFHELEQVAANFDLLLGVNFPGVREAKLAELSRLYGNDLSHQSPVAGMYGSMNYRKVRQFRMPGYPLFLVTMDILQEGEDLHTFCRTVIHYGMPWTPSSMEQRTGRVDRIGSLTYRRLDNRDSVTPDELLQVHYPHLKDTVERLQAERVYERINRFVRLMHRSLAGERTRDSRVDVARTLVAPPRDIAPITDPLTTPFEVQPDLLHEDDDAGPVDTGEARNMEAHFSAMVAAVEEAIEADPESHERRRYLSTCFVGPGGVVLRGAPREKARQQPFTLFLHSAGNGRVVVRCVSPVGVVGRDDPDAIVRIDEAAKRMGFVKVCAVENDKEASYDLTVEADVLFHPETTQAEEVVDLVRRTCGHADMLELALLRQDESMERFRPDLAQEAERD